MTLSSLLHFAAILVFVLTGVLLLLGSAISLTAGLALVSFALAAWAAAGVPWRP